MITQYLTSYNPVTNQLSNTRAYVSCDFEHSKVFLTPEAGFGAPSGCSCVAGDGITAGCAKHKGISPACLGVDGVSLMSLITE